MNARKLGFGLQYAVRTVLLRQNRPLLLAVVITDRCNLDCFYCRGSNAGKIHCSRVTIRDILTQAYERGHRAPYFTGGEPMLWESDGWNMGDVVQYARELGFFDVFIFTNGTVPLNVPGCRYIVTVDGPREVHNRIRQGTWDVVMENVGDAPPGTVSASITLTTENAEYFEQYVPEISALGIFSGIAFNFLTASPKEMAEKGLLGEQRARMLDTIWNLKAQGIRSEYRRRATRYYGPTPGNAPSGRWNWLRTKRSSPAAVRVSNRECASTAATPSVPKSLRCCL
ncbi:radical SAM protein [bacterium]|nr:radical SAM protein [bacterium]